MPVMSSFMRLMGEAGVAREFPGSARWKTLSP
jgi:hypothetical protein